MLCFETEIRHQREIQAPTPSPATMAGSPLVDTIFQGSNNARGDIQTIENIELEDASVKIEEVPLTVPHLNHAISAPVIPTKPLTGATLKKSHSEKLNFNKKSPRKCIPTRGNSTCCNTI